MSRPDTPESVRPFARAPILLLLLAAGALLVLVSLGVGRYPLHLSDVLALLGAALGGAAHGRDAATEQVFWQLRLPRVMAAALVGAALAVSGACLQRAFRNPLAAPELLGVSAGAALGAALAILAGTGWVVLQISAFGGGLAAIALVLALGPLLPARDRLLGLVLTGSNPAGFRWPPGRKNCHRRVRTKRTKQRDFHGLISGSGPLTRP